MSLLFCRCSSRLANVSRKVCFACKSLSAAANDRYPVTELDELLLSPDNKVSHLCFNTNIAQRVDLISDLSGNEYCYETDSGNREECVRSDAHFEATHCLLFQYRKVRRESSPIQTNKLLLALDSTVVLGFGTHDQSFVLCRLLHILKGGLLFHEKRDLIAIDHTPLLGSDSDGAHSHSIIHSLSSTKLVTNFMLLLLKCCCPSAAE
jgi:hypothetical protein